MPESLITGATGFIGANLARRLLTDGHEVHILCREQSSLWRLEDVRGRCHVHRADLVDVAETMRVVDAVRPDIAFHLAAGVHHPRSREARASALENAILGTAHVLEALRLCNGPRLVQAGSSTEYAPRDRPLREDDPLLPVSHRGAVKGAASLLAAQYGHDTDHAVIILRLASVYGPWERADRLVPTLFRAALFGAGEGVPLTPPGIAHDFVHVDDVVDALLAAATAEVDGPEVFNIGTGTATTNEEVLHLVEAISGCRIPAVEGRYRPRPLDAHTRRIDSAKAGDLLGWRASHSLEAGLALTHEWYREHPDALRLR